MTEIFLDGSEDDQLYAFPIVYEMYWNQTWMFNPFTSENGFRIGLQWIRFCSSIS